MFRSGNPALKAATFTSAARVRGLEAMTVSGAVNKTGVSLLILIFAAALVWNGPLGRAGLQLPLYLGLVGGLLVALVTVFKHEWAPVTTPLYAALEGLFLGAVSLSLNRAYPGIALNAAALTFATLAALLLAYRAGWIRASQGFTRGIVAATGGIALVYLVSIVLGLFGRSVPLIHGSGPVGIGFSLVVVGVAALNLVLDFDLIERAAVAGAPKYMEWYGAFALLVTLVWLYLEILRLLAKLQGRGRR